MKEAVDAEIANLNETEINVEGTMVHVQHKLIFTMINGKVSSVYI